MTNVRKQTDFLYDYLTEEDRYNQELDDALNELTHHDDMEHLGEIDQRLDDWFLGGITKTPKQLEFEFEQKKKKEKVRFTSVCECGSQKLNLPHSHWCPKFRRNK